MINKIKKILRFLINKKKSKPKNKLLVFFINKYKILVIKKDYFIKKIIEFKIKQKLFFINKYKILVIKKDHFIKKIIEFKIKQKLYIFLNRSKQYIYNKITIFLYSIYSFINSTFFHIIIVLALFLFIHFIFNTINPIVSKDNLYSFSFAIAGIIGASIAIIFSFSTFILQSTADLFSTQYLNKFINNKKEKVSFWLLVIFTFISFLIPVLYNGYNYELGIYIINNYIVIELLLFILFIAFYLIFILYRELRNRINPETTLKLINNDAINKLIKINKILKKQAVIQNKIFEYQNETKNYTLDINYKKNINWKDEILENIKYLYEIGLRLLSKNEINSFNLSIKFIHDIFIKHLELRNNYFIRMPVSFLGTYSFNDEGFTSAILEYIQSIGNRLIQENKKENIYYLLEIYESIILNSLNVVYADKENNSFKDNPLTSLILGYYGGLINSLINSKERDWIWEGIKSLSKVSHIIVNKTDSHLLISNINGIIEEVSIYSFKVEKDYFLLEILNIYFNQILIAWNKYDSRIFWNDLYRNLKVNILYLSVILPSNSLSVSEKFISFQSLQVNIINGIFDKIKEDFNMLDSKVIYIFSVFPLFFTYNLDNLIKLILLKINNNKELKNFIKHLKGWSDFLLDISRDIGLDNNTQVGLSIIQSVENNLRIIYGIKNKFNKYYLDELYKTQFYTLSWYFEKTKEVDSSLLFNLDLVLTILFEELYHNIKEKTFDITYLIELYIKLIEQHFDKSTIGNGYNHPRIIVKLIHLGLLVKKLNFSGSEHIIGKIEELNNKYLELNKIFFQKKEELENLMGPNKYQLCKEINELEKDLFSHNEFSFDRMKNILRKEITKEDWDEYIIKIEYCKNVKYTTTYL